MSKAKYYLIAFSVFFQINFLFSQIKPPYSPYGKVFTPKGKLRILLIYAGFENFDENQWADWEPYSDMPKWSSRELFYQSEHEFASYAKDTSIDNISKYYHEMSMGKFELLADIFPERINIDISNAYSFGSCNRLVMEKMKNKYPNFDWSRYDSRTNAPNYMFDNSISKPDHKPDYVVIAYRYNAEWSKHPKHGMQNWVADYSVLDGLYGFEYNGYTFDGSGFTLGNFQCRKNNFKDLFYHELAHELFSCPHYSGANGAIGRYLNIPSGGTDMMNFVRGYCASSFERWLLGWVDVKFDLDESSKKKKTYRLRDCITTGDCIRLKIPHSNQYLWIENRQKHSIFDHNPWRYQLYNIPKGSKGIPDKEAGLYMYIEEVLDKREHISTGLVYDLDKVNGIMPLHALGNYDYKIPNKFVHTNHSTPEDEKVYWNNKVYWFERSEANPISGVNPFVAYRYDLDGNGIINNVIGRNGEFNGMADTESFSIVMEKVKDTFMLTYANICGRNADIINIRRPDSFIHGDKLGISYNPPIVNRPKFDIQKDSLLPVFTNGLCIKIKKARRGVVKTIIKHNQNRIQNNVRWCGNIVVKPLPNCKYALKVCSGAELRIDKTNTVNNLKKSELNFCDNSVVRIDSGATVYVCNGAKLKLMSGQTLEICTGGKLVLAKHAKLELEEKSILIGMPIRK